MFPGFSRIGRRLQVGLIVWPLYPLNLNPVLVLPRLGKIVIELHPEPGFRTASEGFEKPDRHFRRNPALTVNKVVERLAGYTKRFCTFGYGQSQRLKAIITNALARVRRVFHRRHLFVLPLMVVDQVNVGNIAIFKPEDNAPISRLL